MKNEDWIKIYKKAYKIIGRNTPLAGDCGLLCNNACCQGDSTSGMLLFPGEENIFKSQKHSKIFSLTPLHVDNQLNTYLVVCQGECKRKYRPLACRIFPYLPIINTNNEIEVIKDPRAFSVCPLVHLQNEDFHDVKNESFENSIYEAFSYLVQYDYVPEFLNELYKSAREYKLTRDIFLDSKNTPG